MADDAPRPDDDDATRIYRPYGSPPPDDPPGGGEAPDPFAPDAPSSGSPDPFSADPFAPSRPSAPDPFASDPFAPDPPAPPPGPPASRAPSADPFAPDPSPDPFAPDPSPTDLFGPPVDFDPPAPPPSPAASVVDPFAPDLPAPAAPDPYAPPPTPQPPDPFAPVSGPPPADPFAPPPPDPFAPPAEDPFAPSAPDPFRGGEAASDPFAPSPAEDPFVPPAPSPPTPEPPPAPRPGPFAVTPADPFAPPPPVPAPSPPERAPDPFTVQPGTATDDPFAALKGPGLGGGGGGFDSSIRDHPLGGDGAMDLPDAFGTERTLAGAFTPVFSLILQLRAADRLGDGTALRQRIEALLSDAAHAARDLGVPAADIDEATFAVVAFLDEAILATDWPGHGAWSSQPLQLTHYDRYDAGEQVFERLKRLLDEGGTRTAVLEVYYLCLALGFKGRYAIHGREVLRRLVDDLHGRLERAHGAPGVLSPRGRSREVPTEAEKGGIPTWALWVGAAVLVALLYIGLSVSLSGAARDTAADLRSLSAAPAE